MANRWIADRMRHIEASGIRRAFELARTLKDPINLSIGLPDFDVPPSIQEAAIQAIRTGHNAYTLTAGLPELRDRLMAHVAREFAHADRQLLVTSGTAGGLLLALCATVNPGDEVIVFDPYFVMYNNLIALTGGTPVIVDTYPDFQIPIAQVERAISPRTRCILVNSPNNPTGVVYDQADLEALARLAHKHDILLISDEVYRGFTHDQPHISPARWNPDTLVVDGFSKTYGMTGWRLGFAHGPGTLIQEMAKLQQFSFVCAPAPLQKAVVDAIDLDLSTYQDAYRHKRDLVREALAGLYTLPEPGGAFYAFPRIPEAYASATDFVQAALQHNLVIIPGNVFSRHDTHFRISYAVDDRTLQRGLEVLRRLANP